MPAVAPRASLARLARYTPSMGTRHGGHVIRLSANEGALGPSPKAVAAYQAAAAEMHRYPHGADRALIDALAAKHGLEADRIVIGAGSDELIQLLCIAYLEPGDEAIHTEHGFLMYPLATQVAGGVPVKAKDAGLTASIDAILAAVTERTRIVFLANPNNPTGTYLPEGEIARLHAALPARVLLVLDAAYAEYVQRNDYAPGHELAEHAGNVVMLRTFSKLYGMAGMRLGWAYGPREVADLLGAIKQPYNVSSAAIAAGIAALADTAFEAQSRAHNAEWLPWLQARLGELGLACEPTVANFFLVRMGDEPGRDAAAAVAFLAERGILVREMRSYGLPQYFRVSVGLPEEMKALVDALALFVGRGR